MEKQEKIKILFLCTGNSCRSQMAEGWTKKLKNNQIEAYSAGLEGTGLNQMAVKVMNEAGVDISAQYSKSLDRLKPVSFDYVVTVCKNADERCPVFGGSAKVIHVGFDDPPELARYAKTDTEALQIYRGVRDQIKTFVESLPTFLESQL